MFHHFFEKSVPNEKPIFTILLVICNQKHEKHLFSKQVVESTKAPTNAANLVTSQINC